MEELKLLVDLGLMLLAGILTYFLKRHHDEIKLLNAEIQRILSDGVVTREELERLLKLVYDLKDDGNGNGNGNGNDK